MERQRSAKKRKNIRWNTLQVTAAGFLSVILLGGILLYLPVSNTRHIAFIDALFTSVSAVCVTGLVTVVPAVQFTLFGKVVLLLLIQVGGLGVIACGTLFLFLLRRQITVREKIVIQESYSTENMGGILDIVKKVVLGTLVVEGAGAVLYGIQFIPEYGLFKGIGYSIFHSVSAFCNAGIDILGDSSLAGYVTNPLVNITTVLLIILSGVGFMVWFDMIDKGKKVLRKECPCSRWFTRLRLQSKLALLTTLILIVVGTLFVFFAEYHNAGTIGDLNFGQKLMASLFQSVTTRTAGFSTFSQKALHEESKIFCSLLMFIGGSPGGTAGGIKTTTVAMLILACFTFVRGGNDTECMGRKITTANIRTGFFVTMVAMAAFLTGTLAILAAEPDSVSAVDVIYETASAVGTAGLTADLTPHLGRVSHCILMVMMYIGRIGPLTLVLLFGGKSHPRDRIRSLPEEQILVG